MMLMSLAIVHLIVHCSGAAKSISLFAAGDNGLFAAGDIVPAPRRSISDEA